MRPCSSVQLTLGGWMGGGGGGGGVKVKEDDIELETGGHFDHTSLCMCDLPRGPEGGGALGTCTEVHANFITENSNAYHIMHRPYTQYTDLRQHNTTDNTI